MSKEEYQKLHRWVRKHLGKATYCSLDKNHKAKQYDWANISGSYKQEVADYRALCRSCHNKLDFTEERRKKLLKNKNAIRKEIIQRNKLGKIMRKYSSVRKAAMENKISRTAITNCLRNRAKTSGGYIWQYHTTSS